MDQPLLVDGSVGWLWCLVLAYHMMMRLLYPDGPTSLSWLALVFGFALPNDDEVVVS